MSVASILRQAGFRPRVPDPQPPAGNAGTVVAQRVPAVPVVPVHKQDGEPVRGRLLALAEQEGCDAALVERIPPAELPLYAELSDEQRVAVLSMLADSADMEAGRVPAGYTQPAICQHCGPVWLWPRAGDTGPNDWPHVLGCPWCHVTMPLGHRLPRPRVESTTCVHWTPDTVNPAGGRGQCACGSFWPHERHTCDRFQPSGK